ncbi:lysylphosphatidylglycerol synthase transmembrane domain-containing protein [Haloferula sargassicola]|uniref:Flippase-like domain-containing protein n=1 Tax=Haloferula sargassicola TaxID=490096 RepID=A0ABP9UH23_9BACT
MKKALFFLLKLALTGACLSWALKGVDWSSSIFTKPGELAWRWAVPGVLLAGLTAVLTATRLWLLLRAQNIRISLLRAIELTLIGNLFNLAAVGGIGGDAARIFLLIRDHPERKLAVTMTVLFDHLVGLVAMSLVFFALTAGRFDALASQSVETRGILRFSWMFFTGGLVMVFGMFIASYPPIHDRIHARGRHWKIAFLRQLPLIYDVYRKKWRHGLVALLVAAMMLPIYYATFWCGARVAGSEVDPGPILTAMPVVDMVSALPLSVAGLGVREKSLQVLMEDLTGMAPDVAVAASLVGFLFTLVWAIPGALLFLHSGGKATLRAIRRMEEETPPDVSAAD